MTKLFAHFQSLEGMMRDSEEGQTLVEYALILSLVAIAAIAGLQAITGALDGVWATVTGAF